MLEGGTLETPPKSQYAFCVDCHKVHNSNTLDKISACGDSFQIAMAFWCSVLVSAISSMGNMVLELYWKHAPNTCRNFAELARRGYYNGIKFHRVIAGFMLQTGDPTGTGIDYFSIVLNN